MVTITNSCAANVLGLVHEGDFSYGNVESARRCMQPIADYLHTTVEDVATQIMERSYEKVSPIIFDLARKYRLEHDQISLVGVGGGATSLIRYVAKKMDVRYSVPENAEVISSIGVALAMVRDVVERVVPNPTPEDIRAIKVEAINKAVESGAEPSSVEVHIEIDAQTSKLTAIATGSTEVKTTDLLKECSEEEALTLASEDMRQEKEKIPILLVVLRASMLMRLQLKERMQCVFLIKKALLRFKEMTPRLLFVNQVLIVQLYPKCGKIFLFINQMQF